MLEGARPFCAKEGLEGSCAKHSEQNKKALRARTVADYLRLGVLKRLFPAVPIMALTATATARVRADVQTLLGISGCPIFQVAGGGWRDALVWRVGRWSYPCGV